MRRGSERVRISSQLVDAGNVNHICAERYGCTLTDVFTVQDEIWDAVATAIGPTVGVAVAESQRAMRRPPRNSKFRAPEFMVVLWVDAGGRPRTLRGATVTADDYPVATVVCVQARDMKEPWCLIGSTTDAPARALINLNSRRWTIECGLRDAKDIRMVPCRNSEWVLRLAVLDLSSERSRALSEVFGVV